MRQLSLESGYGLSDIKERIYFSPDHNMAGLMIYTSGSDSGGSLGGLVRAIKPGYFENLFRNAIYNSRFCSRDPICYENNQEGLNKLNFAACHACCMTSDLACETRSKNSYLDRKTIIGDRNKEHGYFNSF